MKGSRPLSLGQEPFIQIDVIRLLCKVSGFPNLIQGLKPLLCTGCGPARQPLKRKIRACASTCFCVTPSANKANLESHRHPHTPFDFSIQKVHQPAAFQSRSMQKEASCTRPTLTAVNSARLLRRAVWMMKRPASVLPANAPNHNEECELPIIMEVDQRLGVHCKPISAQEDFAERMDAGMPAWPCQLYCL